MLYASLYFNKNFLNFICNRLLCSFNDLVELGAFIVQGNSENKIIILLSLQFDLLNYIN